MPALRIIPVPQQPVMLPLQAPEVEEVQLRGEVKAGILLIFPGHLEME